MRVPKVDPFHQVSNQLKNLIMRVGRALGFAVRGGDYGAAFRR